MLGCTAQFQAAESLCPNQSLRRIRSSFELRQNQSLFFVAVPLDGSKGSCWAEVIFPPGCPWGQLLALAIIVLPAQGSGCLVEGSMTSQGKLHGPSSMETLEAWPATGPTSHTPCQALQVNASIPYRLQVTLL